MYALERLVFQGTEHCPQYRWKQFALCGSRTPLEKVKAGQQSPGDWRIVFIPGSAQAVLESFQQVA